MKLIFIHSIMRLRKFLLTAAATISIFPAAFAASDSPAITFHSDAYSEVGSANRFSFLIGVTETDSYTVKDAKGTREVTLSPAYIEDGSWQGSWISLSAGSDGIISIWGDPSKINTIVADGAYLTSVEMENCADIEVLSLEHNTLRHLDLSPFRKLMAIYLTDNPFSPDTPVVIGAPKPDLQILEVDIIDNFDPNFNMSDYPELRTFDAYANYGLSSLDPTGCPELLLLSCEMSKVASLDVSKNPKLLRLNISETRISEIDLSNNSALEHLLAGHDSGSINVGYKLNSIDLSHNPELTILNLNGNGFKDVDLSANPKLTNVSLIRNSLTSLDVSSNPSIYSLNCFFNDLDFATLPWPQFGEYFYKQNALAVPRAIAAGEPLDLSERVIREGTTTFATAWRQIYGADPVPLEDNLYTYAEGKVTFPQEITDSVYVVFSNDVFSEYALQTTPFRVRKPSELGQPSPVATFNPSEPGKISLSVGMDGASSAEPKLFFVDFGDGKLEQFYASTTSDEPESPNVAGTASGPVTIYLPEGEVATSLYLHNTPLASADITKATELRSLAITSAALADLDLRYNRCLQWLDLSGNNLSVLDLTGIYGDYEKNVLTYLDASSNNISSFTNMAPLAMHHLNLSTNKLESIVLKDYDNLEYLDLSGNRLEYNLDMTYLYAARHVDVSDNLISSVTECAENNPEHLDLSNNLLTIATLPLPSSQKEGYIYAPQAPVEIPAESAAVDLRHLDITVNGNPTSFQWMHADGTPVASGVTVDKGLSTFTDSSLGQVYCVIRNDAYPLLSGANELRTSVTEVVTEPSYMIASFIPVGANGTPNIVMAADEPLEVYADFLSNGTLTPIRVGASATICDGFEFNPGQEVRMYVASQAMADKISVFSLNGMTIDHVDASPLTHLYCFGIHGAGVTPEKIVMPQSPHLAELLLTGNEFDSYPYAELYPEVSYLVLSGNRFTSFDASAIPSLMNLSLADNQLTEVTFDNPSIWNLQLDSNNLTELDLSGLPGLEQLILNSNSLSSIDLSPVTHSLHVLSIVGNNFTFATLPRPSECDLWVYYFGNQAPIEAECVDMTVDLSSQAFVGDTPTSFAWYAGIPTFNSETGEIEGTLLEEELDYRIEKGITTFLSTPDDDVVCVMTNPQFEGLYLITYPLAVSSAEMIFADPMRTVTAYSIDGRPILTLPAAEIASRLPKGLYIIDGKKIIIK